MRPILRVIRFFAIFLSIIGAHIAWAEPLMITTQKGTFPFEVEVVDTPESRAKGLMYRKSMPEDQGMLFILEQKSPLTMWMRNTYIPLDMVFFDLGGRITKVYQGAEPHSTRLISSGGAVWGVLEVNAGVAERLGIEPGNRLTSTRIEALQ